MLYYLISFLDDWWDFSWYAAKACDAVLLCRMEQGKVKDFTQVDSLDRIRYVHAQRFYSQNFQQVKTVSKK